MIYQFVTTNIHVSVIKTTICDESAIPINIYIFFFTIFVFIFSQTILKTDYYTDIAQESVH